MCRVKQEQRLRGVATQHESLDARMAEQERACDSRLDDLEDALKVHSRCCSSHVSFKSSSRLHHRLTLSSMMALQTPSRCGYACPQYPSAHACYKSSCQFHHRLFTHSTAPRLHVLQHERSIDHAAIITAIVLASDQQARGLLLHELLVLSCSGIAG